MDDGSECRDALEQAAQFVFTGWRGLSETCRPEDFAAVFDGGEDDATGRLSGRSHRFRVYRKAGVSNRIQAWFHMETGDFMVAVFTYPEFDGDTAATLAALGEPEVKLEPLIGAHPDAEQWVYAARGLTLYVRPGDPPAFRRIAVYPPTQPEIYENRLGAHDHRRYHPRRR